MTSAATMNPSTTTATVDNGVNVAALLGAREALTATPEAARFKWRATSEWLHGTHSRATIDGFFGLGGEQKHRQTYRYESDHPEIFASPDNGATPVEFVLVGLAGCLTAGVAAVAQHRGIQLRSVKATLEAGMDLQGILGIDEQVRNGFDGISVHYEIDAEATPEQIEALVAQSQKRSAVFDIVTNPTDVTVTARKA
ncbi:MAG: OsmC family protein [Burkholderiaceae bacterium]|nr:OsmC family protein [Burkholderiaceae bacterium]